MDNNVQLSIDSKMFEQIIKQTVIATIKEIKLQLQNDKEYLSYREAATLLDIKVSTLMRRTNNGIYKKYYQKNGGKPYLKRSEILDNFK